MPTFQHATRLAPSPTGALHLGNARTFLVNYLLARTRGWHIVMRMEDLDGPRVKAGAVDEAIADLEWLGLEWDTRTEDQSRRGHVYATAVQQLLEMGRAYPCTCSRTDVQRAASAPHREDGPVAYPGTCRRRWTDEGQATAETDRPAAIRLEVGDAAIDFKDMVAGEQSYRLADTCGDFVIRKSDGVAGYQLAVVLDDAAGEITDVVRADDLLESTARQVLLHRELGLGDPPRYWHLPLIVGEDGIRLAKRHGDTRLSQYRADGTSPQRMLGLLAHWSGLIDTRRPIDMAETLDRFDITRLPTEPVVFTAHDHDYLLER